MFIRGIDISHWQGDFNPEKAINGGIKFVIAKGSDFYRIAENGFYDSRVTYYASLCRGYSIPFGIYMWFKPQYNIRKQGDFFLNLFNSLKPEINPVIDFEEIPSYMTYSEVLYKLQEILEYIETRTYLKPILYSRDTIINLMPTNKRGFLKSYAYWKAWYPYKFPFISKQQYNYFPEKDLPLPNLVYPFTEENLVLWQFSEKGDGNYYGVSSGYVDLDYCVTDFNRIKTNFDAPDVSDIYVKVVAKLGLRVREQPNLTSKIIKVLPYGTIVKVNLNDSTEDFYKLADEDGYIYKEWVDVTSM